MKIPLHKPFWGRQAEALVVRAMRTGSGTADGAQTSRMRELLMQVTGAKHAVPVTSCTHAMEAIVAVLGAKTGDEIIVPSFTLSSTATAAMIRGAVPVFADIDPVTFSLDPVDVEKRITKRTVGIMTVEYAGMAGKNLDALVSLAKRKKLWLVEDAAHCIGSRYRGRSLGTFGVAGAFSFHGTKNVASGEGGAVVTGNRKLWEQLEIFRSIGTDRVAFLMGKVSAYRWVGEGSSYMLSDILAALINAQLPHIDRINAGRARVACAYSKHLARFTSVLTLPIVPEGMTTTNWHIYAVRLPDHRRQQAFIRFLRKKHVEASAHYMPLHASPMGRKLSRTSLRLPVTEDVADTIVRLPIYAGMTAREIEYVITTIEKAVKSL